MLWHRKDNFSPQDEQKADSRDPRAVKILLSSESPPAPKRPFNGLLSREAIIFIILTLCSLFVLFKYVDLTPHVDQDFFFSNEDPLYQEDIKISKLFTRKDSQVIISIRGNILSPVYHHRISNFTDLLTTIPGVTGVKSITQGPKNVHDALKSHFWRRLLIPESRRSSNILVIVNESDTKAMVEKIDGLVEVFNKPDFRITVSGFPYISEQIRRHLDKDLKTFSTMAFVLFGIVIIMIFHSWRIFLGMVISCLNAATVTFLITHFLNLKIGILTANLITIIFVLTLSHIVFLTFNWKNIHKPEDEQFSAVKEAVRVTVWASFWCMLTTLLGFMSLLLVPAKPLRELGIAGAIGTAASFLIVYTVFPTFLRLKENSYLQSDAHIQDFYKNLFSFLKRIHVIIIVLIVGTIVLTAPKLWELNTDPDLISYFAPGSDIRNGLEDIDRNGGSSPMVMVIRSKSGETLNTGRIYRRMWALHNDLEKNNAVGTMLSLPILMAEGKRSPFSFFIIWEWYLRALEKPKYDSIANSFVTKDRLNSLILFRMKEMGRTESRLEVVEDLKRTVEAHHFIPALTGGIYALQGHLARLVAHSLIYSLGQLILIFAFIAFIFGRSLMISLAMTFSIGIIPLCILGVIGYFKIPLDTISAPAANVALGMGIDSMIHMVNIFHHSKKNFPNNFECWDYVTRRMAQPILTSMIVITAGFGIFFFSSFPPTQRFGGSIVFGSIIAAFTALFIFPLLARRRNT